MLRLVVVACLIPGMAWAASGEGAKPKVRLETSKGVIVVELDPAKAPKTVANFLEYVRAGAYNGTIFHRVIPNFMIQGGGMIADYKPTQTRPPIVNEAGNGLPNLRGTIAMARTNVVDSATTQFFINLKDNAFLNHRDESPQGFGYCVFGKVVEGMDVVDAIAAIPTGPGGPFASDVPKEQVVIKSARVVGGR